jgi:hypothetical protein
MNARAIVAPFVVRGEAEGAERSIFPQLMISGEPTETTIVRGEAEGAEGSIFPQLMISGEPGAGRNDNRPRRGGGRGRINLSASHDLGGAEGSDIRGVAEDAEGSVFRIS